MKIKIVLVDHNNIFDESLESECLIEIIDHHQLGKFFSEEKVRLTVQAVGSCSTLVMDRIWKEHPSFKVKSNCKNTRSVNVALPGNILINW